MEVLQSLYGLTADISENRFITTRPPSAPEHMQDFLLIRLPQGIRDRGDTYQKAWAQIAVFVRDVQGGLENTLRLDEIQQSVMDLFPIVTELFHGKNPILLDGGTDGAGFHSVIIHFSITILKH